MIEETLAKINQKLDEIVSYLEALTKVSIPPSTIAVDLVGEQRDIYELCDLSKTIDEIAKTIEKSASQVRKSLTRLRNKRLVDSITIGKNVFYFRIPKPVHEDDKTD